MPSIENQMQQEALKAICLVQGCRERPAHKGLCLKCYAEAKKLVEAGKTTWLDLEMLSLASSDESKFMRAFKQKQKEQS